MRLARPLVGFAALVAAVVTGSSVRAASLNAAYSIALAGLPLGTADISSSIEGDRYQLQVQARLTGLAGLIMSGGGGAQASGSVAGGRPVCGFSLNAENPGHVCRVAPAPQIGLGWQ